MSLVLNVEILGEFKKLTAATSGAEKSLKGLQTKVSNISRGIATSLAAIGVGFGISKVVDGIKDSIQAASDQEQQFGAIQSIFKELAPEMKDFAENQYTIGLSTADAARSMSLLGSQLKGYGLSNDEAASKTKELTGLAADLAATFGGTTADAVASISSLFRGEYDPIEKYGVAIKKSDVNARLAAEGLDILEGEALKQAEAQAALALLFEKTGDAQGQAARESDTYASKSAELQAKFTNLKAEVGEKLLPVMITLMEAIQDNWAEIETFITQLGDLIPVILNTVIPALKWLTEENGFGGLDAKIGLVSGSLYFLLNSRLLLFAASNPTMALAVAGIGLIAAGMYTVYTNTKSASTAIEEFQRLQSIKAATSNPVATPEQINAATYKGILDVAKPDIKVPSLKVPQGIAGQSTKNAVVNNYQTNTNVTVKKSTATGKDIATAINKTIKSSGTNVIKAI